jgi:Putative  PD-(D/E)XK family member, (DUF4420)
MSSRHVDLLQAFGELGTIDGPEDTYVAKPVRDWPCYRIAKDSAGNAALLVATQPDEGHSPAPIELRNLSFRPNCSCRVVSEGRPKTTETLAVLKCVSDEGSIRQYFLRSLSGILVGLAPNGPSVLELSSAVSKLSELFRSIEEPPQATLQGLWSELFLIAEASDIALAADAWHSEPRALHDFSLGEERIEVKSTTSSRRVHEFLLDQLLPPVGTEVVVASFVLQESVSGLSIEDLWRQIAADGGLSDELVQRMLRVISLSLGRDWRDARRVSFDRDAALRQLRFYDASVLPKVGRPAFVEISDIRFRCDLSDIAPISRSRLAKRGLLFSGIIG